MVVKFLRRIKEILYGVFVIDARHRYVREERSCMWLVNDNEDDVGNYIHEYAVKSGKGFCAIHDLFTECNGKCWMYEKYITGDVKNE